MLAAHAVPILFGVRRLAVAVVMLDFSSTQKEYNSLVSPVKPY